LKTAAAAAAVAVVPLDALGGEGPAATGGTASFGSLSPRMERIKARFLNSPYAVDIERALNYTRAWRRSEGLSPARRAAEGLAEALAHQTIRIEDDELLVGVKSNKPRGNVIAVEKGTLNGQVAALIDPAVDLGLKSAASGAVAERTRQLCRSIPEEEARLWREEILPVWEGKTANDLKRRLIEEAGVFKGLPDLGPATLAKLYRGLGGLKGITDTLARYESAGIVAKQSPAGSAKRPSGAPSLKGSLSGVSKAKQAVQDSLPDLLYMSLSLQGHTIPGYKRVLAVGFRGIQDCADKESAQLRSDDEESRRKKDFYEAVSLVAKAVCQYANRYAVLAEELAAKADEPRRSELLAIARRCRRVPAQPPRDFMEAIQSLWMTQVVLEISYGADNVFSPGRVDQYLAPYYQADLAAGRITRGQAREAIEELMVKAAGEVIQGGNVFSIGGVGRDGEDATNEISHLFLEALARLKGIGDSVPVRISQKTPREFLLKALEVHRVTGGIAFYNDEIVIRDLLEDGFTLEDARDYGVIGCVEPASGGNCFSYTAGNGIMMLGALELALNQGRRVLGDNRLMGAETPDPVLFQRIDEVQDAFEKQLAYLVEHAVRAAELKDKAYAEAFPCLLLSATIEGCLESGKDVTQGGAKYNHGHVNAQALGSVADSLAAIRWAVFDEKIVTMEQLVEAVRTNFQGRENLRQRLFHKAPKYGNDDPRADDLAVWVAETFTRQTRKHRCWRGGVYRPSLFSSGTQHIEGAFLGATPDGRLATEVVSNGVSPVNGMERTGMTALLHSAAKAGRALLSDGTALNLNISPGLLRTAEGVEKLADMILAYFDMGGRHVQFNPLDRKTLFDAQTHPEKYPDLTVKVTGYSAIFADLVKPLQDDIIARTEFREV
jgi:formate C-acetyltransferase